MAFAWKPSDSYHEEHEEHEEKPPKGIAERQDDRI
jgi:hypothetical protein